METARPALFPTLALTALTLAALPAPASARGGIDPRQDAVRLSNVEPSPDGRWVAMICAGESGERGIWLVDLTSALPPRAVEGGFPRHPHELTWSDEGQLGIDFTSRSSGWHWVDPESGELLRVEGPREGGELEGGWAGVEVRKKSRGAASHEIHWVERDETYQLSTGALVDVRLTKLAGVVFYSTRERGVLRIFRHDMLRNVTDEVHEIESGSQSWSVSSDGSALAVRDNTRLHVLDSTDGAVLAGPWADAWLEWLGEDGSRFARLTTGGHHYLLDLWSGRQVHLGPNDAPHPPRIHVLADGRFVLHWIDDRRLDLMDADGELLRNLVPGEAVSEAAAR